MTPEKFKEQIQRIKDNYREAKVLYTYERIDLFWKCFKRYPDGFMERTVTKFILDRKITPMREDFEREFRALEADEGIVDDPNYNEPYSSFMYLCDNCFGYFELTCRQSDLDNDDFLRWCPQCKSDRSSKSVSKQYNNEGATK